ncbi:MAG: gliding motility-associated C-terminal domain-containing protein [Taibaiella sp.]|jgi:gliding motility-associated-like protein
MKIFIYFITLFTSLTIKAQNLVPNPSFEDYVACPSTFGQLPYASGSAITVSDWTKPTKSSSDYFNTCFTSTFAIGIPMNYTGYQYPRTGNAYTGIYCKSFSANDYKEYIQSHLSAPLIVGHRYRINYWINLASWDVTSGFAGVDQMGAYFAALPEERSTYFWVLDDLNPQVKSPVGQIFMDTLGWANVSGIFTAAGNEEWMILGNFTPQDSLHYLLSNSQLPLSQSYYYIDDVCLMDIDGTPSIYQVHDTSLCSATSIGLQASSTTAANYFWDDGSTSQSRAITQHGTYWVKYIFTGDCTLYADTFNVNQIDTVDINLGHDTVVCTNIPVRLNAYKEGATQYAWNTGDNEPSINVTTPGKYYVTVSSDCFIGTDTINLLTPAEPKAILPRDTLLCEGTILSLQYNQSDITNTWNTGVQGCCISVKDPGTYTLTTNNICGDTAADEIEVSFTRCNDCVFIPTAFSPNGDGKNEEYTVISSCDMKSYTLRIFDRWGGLVFLSRTPGESWDGRVNGKPADSGVYFYYLKVIPALPGASAIERKGDISLLK